jgi:DNA/RNA-binding domain of Phe-tRNA-synthetase-like protein
VADTLQALGKVLDEKWMGCQVRTMKLLDVAPELLELGLSAATLIARNVDNTRTAPELIAYRRGVGRRLAAHWKNRSISAHPVIREYHGLHQRYGATDEPPAPEKLVTYVRRNRDFTASAAVVDCYNIVSAKTLLSIGAHDLDKLSLPITLRTTTSQDSFVPLGETGPRSLSEEYAYVDAQGSIICRLDVLQSELTKTTRESRDIAFFLQGNRNLPATVLLKGAWLLSEMVTTFCGGTAELVDFFAAKQTTHAVSLKPQISFAAFKHLKLQKGTIQGTKSIPGFGALLSVSIRTKTEIEALALSSSVPEQAVGQEVIVATDLNPLVIAGKTFTSYLPVLQRELLAGPVQVNAEIPDGERLY